MRRSSGGCLAFFLCQAVRIAALLAATAPILGLAASCARQTVLSQKRTPSSSDRNAFGIIEGRVWGPAGPVAAWLDLRSWNGSPGPRQVIPTDSTGSYILGAPEGSYWLSVAVVDSSGPGPRTWKWNNVHDRIDVRAGERIQVDFPMAALNVRLHAPLLEDGTRMRCMAGWRDGGSGQATEDALVREGWAEFRFRLLPAPRAYPLSFDLMGGDGPLAFPSISRHDTVDVRPALIREVVLEPTNGQEGPGRLSGKVTGAWQQIGAGPPAVDFFDAGAEPRDSVRAVPETGSFFVRPRLARTVPTGGGRGIGWVACRQDGSFGAWFKERSRVRIKVRSGAYSRWVGGSTPGSARVYEVGPGRDVTDVNVSVSGISLRLVAPEQIAEFQGALELYEAAGNRIAKENEVSGDAGPPSIPRGISNLRPGTYYLRLLPSSGPLSRQRWGITWYDGKVSREQADPIVIEEPGQCVPITVHLLPATRITGRILGRDGRPREVLLRLTPIGAAGPPAGYAYSDPRTGDFEMTPMLDGAYRLCIGDNGSYLWFPGTADVTLATVLRIEDRKSLAIGDWVVPDDKEAEPR